MTDRDAGAGGCGSEHGETRAPTLEVLKRLPKIELHCHLDASVRVGTVAEIGRALGLRLPDPLEPALLAPAVCQDLRDYLRCLDLALEAMQRPQDLHRIARELVEDMALDGVIYGEVRFAPQLHTRRGLSPQEALDAVSGGLAEGSERSGVLTGLILCGLRHQDGEASRRVAELAAANVGKVRALDLAGDEGGHPEAGPHAPAFAVAREAGLWRTVHAGENAGPESVRAALDLLGAQRIGHGVRIEQDPALVERVVAGEIALEVCPRSNVQTRAVPSLAAHPVDRLLKRGVRVTISTDGRTSSATTLTEELVRLRDEFGWGMGEMVACQQNAARAAFASEEVRRALRARVRPGPATGPPG